MIFFGTAGLFVIMSIFASIYLFRSDFVRYFMEKAKGTREETDPLAQQDDEIMTTEMSPAPNVNRTPELNNRRRKDTIVNKDEESMIKQVYTQIWF